MPVFDEETFGPVAAVIRAGDEHELIALANRSRYGLGASIWTSDQDRAGRLAGKLDCGSIFVNGPVKSDARLPFGGIKNSGYGRELSTAGIREFVNIKTVWVRGKMTNDEIRMTKQGPHAQAWSTLVRRTAPEVTCVSRQNLDERRSGRPSYRHSSFVIDSSFEFRILSFARADQFSGYNPPPCPTPSTTLLNSNPPAGASGRCLPGAGLSSVFLPCRE